MNPAPTLAYKILTNDQFTALERDGSFAGAPVDRADGYIHLSTAYQVTETLDKHFAGQSDLYIAAIDLEALGETVKWELSRGGQLFPHLYAVLSLDAVTAYGPLRRDEHGALSLPIAG